MTILLPLLLLFCCRYYHCYWQQQVQYRHYKHHPLLSMRCQFQQTTILKVFSSKLHFPLHIGLSTVLFQNVFPQDSEHRRWPKSRSRALFGLYQNLFVTSINQQFFVWQHFWAFLGVNLLLRRSLLPDEDKSRYLSHLTDEHPNTAFSFT